MDPRKFIQFARILFGLVFVFSGIAKLIALEQFSISIVSFKIIPSGIIVDILTYLIPILEIVLGILCAISVTSAISLKLLIYMVGFFTAIVSVKVFEDAS